MIKGIFLILTIIFGIITIYLYAKDKPKWASIITTILTVMSLIITINPSILMQKTFENNMEEKFYKGTITKTGWESKFIGLRYTNPEGMSMLAEEELDGLIELDWENLSNNFSQYELGFINLTTIYEMMSKADDQPTTVMVCVEKLMDETDVFQYVKGYELQLAQFYPINYTLISDDKTVKIGNEDYIKVSYIEEYGNIFMYMDSYFRIVDDRVIMISLIFDDEGARDNVLDAFTAY